MLEEIPLPVEDSPFPAILAGKAPGVIIHRDDDKRFALIQSQHPEAAVHWLAIPFEPIPSIEALENEDRPRFLDLLNYAVSVTRAQTTEFPELADGFTIKFHLGAYETIPHAKLHILSSE